MGCFDTVYVPCPECRERVPFQSKGGKCLMRDYQLESCPIDVLSDINRHAPYVCPKCNTKFSVEVKQCVAESVKQYYETKNANTDSM